MFFSFSRSRDTLLNLDDMTPTLPCTTHAAEACAFGRCKRCLNKSFELSVWKNEKWHCWILYNSEGFRSFYLLNNRYKNISIHLWRWNFFIEGNAAYGTCDSLASAVNVGHWPFYTISPRTHHSVRMQSAFPNSNSNFVILVIPGNIVYLRYN